MPDVVQLVQEVERDEGEGDEDAPLGRRAGVAEGEAEGLLGQGDGGAVDLPEPVGERGGDEYLQKGLSITRLSCKKYIS